MEDAVPRSWERRVASASDRVDVLAVNWRMNLDWGAASERAAFRCQGGVKGEMGSPLAFDKDGQE